MRNADRALLVSASQPMMKLKQEIERIARSDAKVVIIGESGVGKELVAHAIHNGSPRAERVFVPVNCAGLPETLLESELFGHVKGSFTGAYRDKPGKLECADGGTVFLDEVGEMSPRMQGVLLRFLETGELQKVGADRAGRTVDVRVIAATNRNLHQMIERGQFREDLFFRLSVIQLSVPPLRDRKEDIPPLIEHFLRCFTLKNGYLVKGIEPDALAALAHYQWPGNVRQLENVIERLVVTGKHERVTLEDLPAEVRSGRSATMHERRRTVTDDLYRRLLEDQESFWTLVYPLYMQREITKQNVRDLVRRGLEEVRGNYKVVCKLFNVEANDYKKFLNFLRKHDCQLPFKEYRH